MVTWTSGNMQSRHVSWEPHTNRDGTFFYILPYWNISDYILATIIKPYWTDKKPRNSVLNSAVATSQVHKGPSINSPKNHRHINTQGGETTNKIPYSVNDSVKDTYSHVIELKN